MRASALFFQEETAPVERISPGKTPTLNLFQLDSMISNLIKTVTECLQPKMHKSLEINETIFRFMGSLHSFGQPVSIHLERSHRFKAVQGFNPLLQLDPWSL